MELVLLAGADLTTLLGTVSAELYNRETGTHHPPTGSLNTYRYRHMATLLSNGMVLVCGRL